MIYSLKLPTQYPGSLAGKGPKVHKVRDTSLVTITINNKTLIQHRDCNLKDNNPDILSIVLSLMMMHHHTMSVSAVQMLCTQDFIFRVPNLYCDDDSYIQHSSSS